MKAGYILKIDSWENDGDFSNTQEFHSTDFKKVQFVIRLLELTKPWGETQVTDGLKDKILSLIDTTPFLDIMFPNYVRFDLDFAVETLYDLLGVSECGYLRHYESVTLHYLVEDAIALKVKDGEVL